MKNRRMFSGFRLILYTAAFFLAPAPASGQTLSDFVHEAFMSFRNMLGVAGRVDSVGAIQRDSLVLGAPPRTGLNGDRNPLCRGEARLCAFIQCQAENFKHDQSLSSLNLAAQVLGDKKLRHMVGNNPEMVQAACLDQGMDAQRCSVFTRGFLLLNKFINSIERPLEDIRSALPPQEEVSVREYEADDGRDHNFQQQRQGSRKRGRQAMGSTTWSVSQPASIAMSTATENADSSRLEWLSAMSQSPTWTPASAFSTAAPALLDNPFLQSPAMIFRPTPPLSPPLAFPWPTVSSTSSSSGTRQPQAKIFTQSSAISNDWNFRRAATSDDDWDGGGSRRQKRSDDYYDQVDTADDAAASATARGSRRGGASQPREEHYYDDVDNGRRGGQRHRRPPPTRNCLELL